MNTQKQRAAAIHLRSRQYEAGNTELFRGIAQTFGDEIDFGSVSDEKDDDNLLLEMRAQGTLTEENGRIVLAYDETALTGMEGSTTHISFSKEAPDIVTMLRTGAVSTALVFEQGVRHICVYDTKIMPFEICIFARCVKNELTLDGGSLLLDYLVEIHGANAERTVFSLDVTVTEE